MTLYNPIWHYECQKQTSQVERLENHQDSGCSESLIKHAYAQKLKIKGKPNLSGTPKQAHLKA